MTGRHRRQTEPGRHAARTMTIAAASLSALPLTAPLATAADTEVWDRIAECESSGDWSIATGNGYSGGLQFSPSTWREFGGQEFAASAAQATRSEQITVATRVQAVQGWGAWPVCSKKAGATGAAPTIAPSERAATESTRRQDAPSSTAAPAPSRVEVTTPEPKTTQADPAPAQREAILDVVVMGDTLSAISREHGFSVAALAESSDIADPNLIFPGEKIVRPGSTRIAPSPAQSSTRSPVVPERTTNVPDVTSTSTKNSVNARIIAEARTWIGVDYEWGGETRSGVDCSALVQNVFNSVGIDLPRTSAAQAAATERISRSEARPGDLVFGVDEGGVHHVGIYLGNGKQIDAPTEGQTVGVHNLYSDQTMFGRVS